MHTIIRAAPAAPWIAMLLALAAMVARPALAQDVAGGEGSWAPITSTAIHAGQLPVAGSFAFNDGMR